MLLIRARLLAFIVIALGCAKREPPAPTPPAATPPASSTQQVAPTPAATASAPQITQLGTVTVNTEPYCGKPSAAELKGELKPNSLWLADGAVQKKLRVLEQQLKPVAASLVGITFEDESKTAIAVLYPSFDGYEGLQRQLAARIGPLNVALRPSCHSERELATAHAVLQARDWHPKAGATPVGWHLEAAYSAYVVTVDDSAPEVAQALRERLGDLAVVSLGKPRRLSAAPSASSL
jgi:hypothetical protein